MSKLHFLPSGNFLYCFTYYAFYQLLVWLIHLIIISFISFFHFLLEHRLSIIEEWAFEKSWEIAILTKGIALFIILMFILIKSETRDLKKEILPKKAFFNIPMSFYVAGLFLFLFLLWLGNPSFVEARDFSVFNLIISWLGVVVFYGADLLVLYSLKDYYPITGAERTSQFILLPFLFYFCSKGIFIYNNNINFFVVFCMFILMFVAELEKKQFAYPLILLFFVLAPFAAVFGVDPLWGAENSYLIMKDAYNTSSLIIISSVFACYLLAKKMGTKNMFRYFYLGVVNLFKSFVRPKRS